MDAVLTVAGPLQQYDKETVVATTNTGNALTPGKYKPSDFNSLGKARTVIMSVEGRVRVSYDSSDPTNTGQIINDGGYITLTSYNQFEQFRAVRHEGETSDSHLRVYYWR